MQFSNVNTTDITSAIRLGCRMMSNIFNADDNDMPFFGSEVSPNPQLRFSGFHSESHMPGRHLNALLNAEDAGGISVDPDAIEKHTNAAFFSYSGPVALPLNRTEIDRPVNSFTTHNVREGFHALYSLVKYRNSNRAHELADLLDDARLLNRVKAFYDNGLIENSGDDASPDRFTCSNGYLLIPDPQINTPIEMRFPLAEREIALKHRTRDIKVRLQGDSVLAMENHGADLTYFDPI